MSEPHGPSVRRFHEDRSLQTASSLAFTALLALVPLITVALSISSAFPVLRHATEALQRFVVANRLPQARSARVISEQVAVFSERAGRLPFVVGQSFGLFPQLGWLAEHVLRTLAIVLTCTALGWTFVRNPQPHEPRAAETLARLSEPLGEHWKRVDVDLGVSLKQLAAQDG